MMSIPVLLLAIIFHAAVSKGNVLDSPIRRNTLSRSPALTAQLQQHVKHGLRSAAAQIWIASTKQGTRSETHK